MTDKAGPEDNINKFVDMFTRRVEKGQHFHQPYFGCREFPAVITPVDHAPTTIVETRDLGLMLWDIEYSGEKKRPIFFAAHIEDGVLEIPEDPISTLVLSEKGDTS
jgi:CRISPR-associated protein Cas5d